MRFVQACLQSFDGDAFSQGGGVGEGQGGGGVEGEEGIQELKISLLFAKLPEMQTHQILHAYLTTLTRKI